MSDYRLPMDADGVKYHGVIDEDGKFPGQVLYGLDKNGRLKPVNVDDEGNVLTRLTGSIVERYKLTTSSTTIDAESSLIIVEDFEVDVNAEKVHLTIQGNFGYEDNPIDV